MRNGGLRFSVSLHEGLPVLFGQSLPTELVKLLPDGTGTVAVIAVVMLFLKQQDKASALLKEITEAFQDGIKDLTQSNREALTEFGKRETDNRIHFQAQIQNLMDSQLEVTREVNRSLQELTSAVEELRRSNDTHKASPP